MTAQLSHLPSRSCKFINKLFSKSRLRFSPTQEFSPKCFGWLSPMHILSVESGSPAPSQQVLNSPPPSTQFLTLLSLLGESFLFSKEPNL